MAKQVEFHHGVLPQCLAALCHEMCEQSVSSAQKCLESRAFVSGL